MENPLSDIIDRYLTEALSPEELLAFEADLQQNPDLQETVRIRRDMAEALAPSQEEALRQNLDKLGRQHIRSGYPSWYLVLPLVFLLLLIGWWLMRPVAEAPTPSIAPTETSLPAPESTPSLPEPAATPPPESPTEEAPVQEETPLVQPTTTPPPIADNPAPASDLYAANFEPNPLLEAEMRDQLRGGEVSLSLQTPQNGDTLRWQEGPTRLTFGGLLETDRPAEVENIMLYIYSNQLEDYQYGRYLEQTPLQLEATAAGYRFELELELAVDPGRYYYLLEWGEEEQLLEVGYLIVQ